MTVLLALVLVAAFLGTIGALLQRNHRRVVGWPPVDDGDADARRLWVDLAAHS